MRNCFLQFLGTVFSKSDPFNFVVRQIIPLLRVSRPT